MARNQKLTAVLRGRSIVDVAHRDATARVRFDDGSVMTVRTDGTPPADVQHAPVRAVRQRDTILQLDLDPEGTVTFHTAEPTASVMVRDRKGTMEYAD
ncbi:MAG: hypothetical protein IRY91_17775 [Gemmatimonadaceae bacterium]|nr:hypothetical protein [Gemmatimonadaceae bacterium]